MAVTAYPPFVTSPDRVVGKVGTALSFTIVAANATLFNAGPLPAGLSIASTTGVISGTPTIAGQTNAGVTVSNTLGETDSQLSFFIT
jgi:hypothetical protein